jgi:hypothetical protein
VERLEVKFGISKIRKRKLRGKCGSNENRGSW